ncbi:MAG: CHAT domain-containing protein [Bacteroidetes bacterium]|nr:CHAT domain-containing protein [Bacteroidota bacterium]
MISNTSNNKLNYKLGILNACETATGDIEKGEGVINFSRHLYLAGIKSTIQPYGK